MYNVLTLNKISPCGLNEMPKEYFNIYENGSMSDPSGILVRSSQIDNLNKNLLAIARAGAGVNNIPVNDCTQKGIVVFNTPGANANAVKELVIASLILSSRKITSGITWVNSLRWEANLEDAVEKNKDSFSGPEIMGKTLGVIGLGAIGGLVANGCQNLGMNVIGYDPHISVGAAWSLSSKVEKAEAEDALYTKCDYISVHIPFSLETRHRFSYDFFKKCKKGVRILNFSRGGLFDNTALLKAIEEGIVACYVTDFPQKELMGNPNIITIPHLGASTPESEDSCSTMASIQLRNYLLYGNIKNSVNFPECQIPYTGKHRLCIINKNEVNVIGKVTAILAKNGININEMINRSRGDVAYTIIDVDESEKAIPVDEIFAINEIMRGRLIQ